MSLPPIVAIAQRRPAADQHRLVTEAPSSQQGGTSTLQCLRWDPEVQVGLPGKLYWQADQLFAEPRNRGLLFLGTRADWRRCRKMASVGGPVSEDHDERRERILSVAGGFCRVVNDPGQKAEQTLRRQFPALLVGLRDIGRKIFLRNGPFPLRREDSLAEIPRASKVMRRSWFSDLRSPPWSESPASTCPSWRSQRSFTSAAWFCSARPNAAAVMHLRMISVWSRSSNTDATERSNRKIITKQRIAIFDLFRSYFRHLPSATCCSVTPLWVFRHTPTILFVFAP